MKQFLILPLALLISCGGGGGSGSTNWSGKWKANFAFVDDPCGILGTQDLKDVIYFVRQDGNDIFVTREYDVAAATGELFGSTEGFRATFNESRLSCPNGAQGGSADWVAFTPGNVGEASVTYRFQYSCNSACDFEVTGYADRI